MGSRGDVQLLVGRPGLAVNAAVLATAIRVHARLVSDIGTVIASNDGLRAITVKNGFPRTRILVDFIMRILFKTQRLEPVRRVNRRASRMKLPRMDGARRIWNFTHILPQVFSIGLSLHEICSSEH